MRDTFWGAVGVFCRVVQIGAILVGVGVGGLLFLALNASALGLVVGCVFAATCFLFAMGAEFGVRALPEEGADG